MEIALHVHDVYGVFCRISLDILDRFSQFFHHMKALYVQMMDRYLIFRFLKVAMATESFVNVRYDMA